MEHALPPPILLQAVQTRSPCPVIPFTPLPRAGLTCSSGPPNACQHIWEGPGMEVDSLAAKCFMHFTQCQQNVHSSSLSLERSWAER